MWSGYESPAEPPDATVVVPSYRSARTLRDVLDAVTRQRTSRRYEVLVVHSGPEPIAAELPQRYPAVGFFCCPERQLPGTARNWGWRCVKSRWVLFLDADCVASPQWLETLLDAAEVEGADGVGGGVANGSRRSIVAWTMHLVEFGQWLPKGGRRRESDFPSCNALYRRHVLLESGGFPEDLFPAEDSAFNHIIRARGARLFFAPDGRVEHLHRRGLREMLSHCRAIGGSYREACIRYPLPGHRLLALPLPLILGATVLGRFVRILSRLLPNDLRTACLLVALSPLVFAALVAWSAGFAGVAETRVGTRSARDRRE